MPTQIKLKRGLDASFKAVTLQAGEPAFVTDTGKLYVGDGTKKVLINPIDEPIGLDTTKAYTKVKVNNFGQVVSVDNVLASDLPAIPVSKITGLGTAATVNIGSETGNIPVLDARGKLNTTVLPSIAITDTFVVSNQAAMLALTAEVGDIAVRTDTNETYILKTAPASAIGNWVKLLIPADAVTTVNSKTGTVVLVPTDLLMEGYTKALTYSAIAPTDNLSVAISKLEKNFDYFAKSESPTFTGVASAPTVLTTDNSTKIATTAYVQANLAIIDGGTF
ncbi:MAG: hypothetical protein RSB76_02775 [Clostridia bacterium]